MPFGTGDAGAMEKRRLVRTRAGREWAFVGVWPQMGHGWTQMGARAGTIFVAEIGAWALAEGDGAWERALSASSPTIKSGNRRL
jgi:hypothetical protein